jgi:hypothetical protein
MAFATAGQQSRHMRGSARRPQHFALRRTRVLAARFRGGANTKAEDGVSVLPEVLPVWPMSYLRQAIGPALGTDSLWQDSSGCLCEEGVNAIPTAGIFFLEEQP